MKANLKLLLCMVYSFSLLVSCSDKPVKDNTEKPVGEYKATDLPFEFIGLKAEKGSTYSQSVDYKDGVKIEKRACSGISLEGLKLNGKEISLKSKQITQDCMIETEEYGYFVLSQMPTAPGSFSYKVFVTPEQEQDLRKLIKE